MKGYVIGMTIDGESNINYWNGTTPVQNIDEALFVEDITTARQTAGSLQAGYTDRVVTILSGNKGIQLDATPTYAANPVVPTV